MVRCNGPSVVKLSDTPSKNMAHLRQVFDIAQLP
jgi:hypothetical protein